MISLPIHCRPLVSIVCLTYNHEAFVRDAIDGMLAQSYAPLEIIVLDDASSDATALIIEDALRQPACRDIRFTRNARNLGARDNFVKGINLARGKFIVSASADDIMMPTMVEKMVKVWQDKDVSLVATNAIYIDEHANELNRLFRDPALPYTETFETLAQTGANATCFGPTQGFERSLYEEFGWPPAYLTSDDLGLAFFAHLAKGATFIPEPLLKYRIHSRNASLSLEWERSAPRDRLVVEAEIQYVMMAHAQFMIEELERRAAADAARFAAVQQRILPLLEVHLSQTAKKLVAARIRLAELGVTRLAAAA
jgi:hypothetical protein